MSRPTRLRKEHPMKGKNGFALLIAILAIVAVVGAMVYRSASNKELPEDEWFDFEHPTSA